jgi:hypothetical protein
MSPAAHNRTAAQRSCGVATAAALALAVASCAPPPQPAPLNAGALRSSYLDQLGARERAARALDAQVSLWPVVGDRHLPGALASLMLAAPDRCRLHVGSPGGTVLDAVGAGGEVLAWLPGEQTLAEMTSCADSAGITDLPALVVRTAAALWRPASLDSLLYPAVADPAEALEWREAGRTIRVRITREGLPDTVFVSSGSGTVRITYVEWLRSGSVRLPGEFRVSADSARATLRCVVSRVRLRSQPDSSAFRAPGPAGADREPGCELWRVLMTGAGS